MKNVVRISFARGTFSEELDWTRSKQLVVSFVTIGLGQFQKTWPNEIVRTTLEPTSSTLVMIVKWITLPLYVDL